MMALQCSSEWEESAFKEELRLLLDHLADSSSPFDYDPALPGILSTLPCIKDCLHGLPLSWYSKVSERHKLLLHESKDRIPKNNWQAASLRALYQALYNSCWQLRNVLAVWDEEANDNPVHNHRLM